MVALACLAWACLATGTEPEVCLAVGYTESGCGRDTSHASPYVLGICGVDYRYSTVPAWALRTTVGGAIGGARAIRYWQAKKGARWARHYKCGNVATAPECLEKEAEVLRLLARLRPAREV